MITFHRGVLATLGLAIFALAIAAPAQQAPESLPLSQVQKLQIEDYAKDVKLAEQQIELLKVQLAAAALSERRSAESFNGYLAQLRTQLNAPVDKWDFDGSTLSFVPKKSKAAASTRKPAKGAGGGR
ncbi:MAG: hypothetical protein ACRD04_07820 [Terriglobales bacterium]